MQNAKSNSSLVNTDNSSKKNVEIISVKHENHRTIVHSINGLSFFNEDWSRNNKIPTPNYYDIITN